MASVPEELLAHEARVAAGGDGADQLLTPERPDRECDAAGEQAAHELHRHIDHAAERTVVQDRGRPERRGGHHQAGGAGVKRKACRSRHREGSCAAGGGPDVQGQHQTGSERPRQAQRITCQRVGGVQIAGPEATRDGNDDERQNDPGPRCLEADAARLKTRELGQKYERGRHQHGSRDGIDRHVAHDQRRQVKPFADAVQIGEHAKHAPRRIALVAPGDGEADGAEQDEGQPVEEEDEVQLIGQRHRQGCLR